MKVKIKYLGKTMELFGLPSHQKEETIILGEKALYMDVLEKIKEKFLEANKSKSIEEYDIFNDIIVFSKGRILRTMKEKPIDHPEIIIAPLVVGG
jgi:molybdopterin converting factor small subunit